MATRVLIPTALRPYAESRASLEVEGATVGEVLANLAARYATHRIHSSETGWKPWRARSVDLDDLLILSGRSTNPLRGIGAGCEAVTRSRPLRVD